MQDTIIKTYSELLRVARDRRFDIDGALAQGKTWSLLDQDITNHRDLRALVLPTRTMLASFRAKLFRDLGAILASRFSLSVQEMESEGKNVVHHALLILLRPQVET